MPPTEPPNQYLDQTLAELPCLKEPVTEIRWLAFTAVINGQLRKIAIPDRALLLRTHSVEEHIANGTCVSWLEQRRAKTASWPIATAIALNSESFSEHYKATELNDYDAQIELLKTFPQPTASRAYGVGAQNCAHSIIPKAHYVIFYFYFKINSVPLHPRVLGDTWKRAR
ncbi:MAG TPA: hypothetical protein VM581_01245 [Magnetospirillaceae bacterium]|nr:hypothetical protein [Magnetospirillaceae bacterium]